jgi:hypothetical protein
MSFLLDDVARILASPLPRRQAVKLLGGALAGGFLGALGLRRATAQDQPDVKCAAPKVKCGTKCCVATDQCCNTPGYVLFCAPKTRVCCGHKSCPATDKCCTTATPPFCAVKTHTCCGATSCKPGEVCCNGVCCAVGRRCVKGRCEASKGGDAA